MAAVATVAGGAGCLGEFSGTRPKGSTETPTRGPGETPFEETEQAPGSIDIEDTTVETNVDVPHDFQDPPSVSYDQETGEIRTTGTYGVGDACYEEVFPEPTYYDGSDELWIRVTRKHNGDDVCEELLQLVTYRIVVTIPGTPPGTVVAIEDGSGLYTTRERLDGRD